MGTDQATSKITQQLERILSNMSDDLDRVELLTAALAGFTHPVPEYEPTFHHLNTRALREHELGAPDGGH